MPARFDRQRVIRYFRLPADADDARIARAIRHFARKFCGMRGFLAVNPDLDVAGLLDAVDKHVDLEVDRTIALDRRLTALQARMKRRMREADFRVTALNALRFACYAPQPEE